MIVPIDQAGESYLYIVKNAASCGHSVLILVSPDVDSVCASSILIVSGKMSKGNTGDYHECVLMHVFIIPVTCVFTSNCRNYFNLTLSPLSWSSWAHTMSCL